MDYFRLLDLVIDFGLVVLIIMVQLVIYPSFLFFHRENLFRWHTKYTSRIAIIVAPMMIVQVLLAFYFIYEKATVGTLTTLILVCAVWISTFIQFVPIHKKISQNSHSERDLKNLVRQNWNRVILWTLLFIINLLLW